MAKKIEVGTKVLFRHGEEVRRAEIVKIHDDDTVDVNVYGSADTVASHGAGEGAIIFGVEKAKLAKTAQDQAKDGVWFPAP